MSNDWNRYGHIGFDSSKCNKTFSFQKKNAPSLFSRMLVSITPEVAWIEIHVARITARPKIRHRKVYNLNLTLPIKPYPHHYTLPLTPYPSPPE